MDLDALPQYTREEVRQSNQSNWLIVNDLVYDLTDFLRIHPGGSEVLLEYMGLDATSVFEDVGHSSMARTIMLRYVIGRVVTASNLVNLSTSQFCRRDSSVTATQNDSQVLVVDLEYVDLESILLRNFFKLSTDETITLLANLNYLRKIVDQLVKIYDCQLFGRPFCPFPQPFKEFDCCKLPSNAIIHQVNCALLHICCAINVA